LILDCNGKVAHTMKDTVITDDEIYYYPEGQDSLFDKDLAIARLIAEGVLIVNTHWWEKTWSKEAQGSVALGVNCSDFFASASAEAEEILYSEVQELYDLWAENSSWGHLKWCAVKRNVRPMSSVVKSMLKAGVWSDEMEALPC